MRSSALPPCRNRTQASPLAPAGSVTCDDSGSMRASRYCQGWPGGADLPDTLYGRCRPESSATLAPARELQSLDTVQLPGLAGGTEGQKLRVSSVQQDIPGCTGDCLWMPIAWGICSRFNLQSSTFCTVLCALAWTARKSVGSGGVNRIAAGIEALFMGWPSPAHPSWSTGRAAGWQPISQPGPHRGRKSSCCWPCD